MRLPSSEFDPPNVMTLGDLEILKKKKEFCRLNFMQEGRESAEIEESTDIPHEADIPELTGVPLTHAYFTVYQILR